MKCFNFILGAILVSTVFCFSSCKSDLKTETTTKQDKEYTAAYVCPMHCKDSGSEEAGTCSTCGMTLVNLDEHSKNGHKH